MIDTQEETGHLQYPRPWFENLLTGTYTGCKTLLEYVLLRIPVRNTCNASLPACLSNCLGEACMKPTGTAHSCQTVDEFGFIEVLRYRLYCINTPLILA